MARDRHDRQAGDQSRRAFLRRGALLGAAVGALRLYSVAVKDNPTRVRLFEMYADSNADNAHVASRHFQKYKVGTQAMVKSLTLTEMVPVLLGTKPTDRMRAYVAVE